MPAAEMELWTNSLTAQAEIYQSIGEVNFGQHIVSLLLVIGLILLLAWLVKRLGLLKRNAAKMTNKDNIIYFNQFNDQQTLVLMETDQKLRCLIYRGKKIEMATDLPGLRVFTQPLPDKKVTVPASGDNPNDKVLPFHKMLIKGMGGRGKKK